jgi:hypothetical protein
VCLAGRTNRSLDYELKKSGTGKRIISGVGFLQTDPYKTGENINCYHNQINYVYPKIPDRITTNNYPDKYFIVNNRL